MSTQSWLTFFSGRNWFGLGGRVGVVQGSSDACRHQENRALCTPAPRLLAQGLWGGPRIHMSAGCCRCGAPGGGYRARPWKPAHLGMRPGPQTSQPCPGFDICGTGGPVREVLWQCLAHRRALSVSGIINNHFCRSQEEVCGTVADVAREEDGGPCRVCPPLQLLLCDLGPVV